MSGSLLPGDGTAQLGASNVHYNSAMATQSGRLHVHTSPTHPAGGAAEPQPGRAFLQPARPRVVFDKSEAQVACRWSANSAMSLTKKR